MPGSTGNTSTVPGVPADRAGRSEDTDPYTGETLAEIAMADQSDLDEGLSVRRQGPGRLGRPPPSERA